MVDGITYVNILYDIPQRYAFDKNFSWIAMLLYRRCCLCKLNRNAGHATFFLYTCIQKRHVRRRVASIEWLSWCTGDLVYVRFTSTAKTCIKIYYLRFVCPTWRELCSFSHDCKGFCWTMNELGYVRGMFNCLQMQFLKWFVSWTEVEVH